jgi:glutamate synthase (NADPH/NADH) small chain
VRGSLRARSGRRRAGPDRPPATLRHRHPDGHRPAALRPRRRHRQNRCRGRGRPRRAGLRVTLYDARIKPGGLNEFGIAAYKSVDDFAAHEIDWLLSIGGIRLETGKRLGDGLTLDQLQSNFDAVFLGLGLGGVNALRAEGEDMAGVSDAVDFIADLRQAGDLTQLPIGRNVVVIGGGMTAIDAGVQSKLLGAETVTIVYRRGQEAMSASPWEQELAASRGVTIRHWAKPLRVTGNGAAREVEFEYTRAGASGLEGTGETFRLSADQVFKAIGQTLDGAPDGLALEGGKIQTDAEGRTSLPGIWAGGDCATGGDDLTVTAVAEGRDAADSIHAALSN